MAKKALLSFLAVLTFALPAFSQTATVTPTPTPTPAIFKTSSAEKHFIQHVIEDQEKIWTSPFRLRSHDTRWVLPIVIGTGALFTTDRVTSDWVGQRGGLPGVSHKISWGGTAESTLGASAAFYVIGRATHNAKARETGVLALEALIDTGIVTEALKLGTERERPSAGYERSEFFEGGSSFPSGHSSSIWALATVVAHEYHNDPYIKYGAYAAAVAVSMSRFSGRKHFLSDIVVGSAVGFAIGRFVYRERHDTDLDDPGPKTTTWSRPRFVPFYSRGTVGGSLVWQF